MWTAVITITPSALVSAGASAAESPAVIHFVVDISGSMYGAPLEQAKAALHEAAEDLSSTQLVGLRAYEGPCGDGGDLVVPIAPFNEAVFDAAVDGLTTGGTTPTPDALRAAASDLPSAGDRTIVLISDGQSSCGDPCPVAREIKDALGVDFRVHGVGFNAPAQAAAELTCIATVTGGQYVEASDSESLKQALDQVVGQPAPNCPDAYFIAVKGSGQPFNSITDLSNSPQIKAVYDATLAKASNKRIQLVVIDYPAVSVDTLWAGLKSAKNKVELVKKLQANARGFIARADEGVPPLASAITAAEFGCRNAEIVLAGYSQGAMVVHEWLNAPERSQHPNIVGVALLADPERVARSNVVEFGSAPHSSGLINDSVGVCSVVSALVSCTDPYALTDISPMFVNRTVSVCQRYDLVCDTGKVVADYPVNTQSGRASLLNLAKSTHGSYSWLPATKTAGHWLAQRIMR